MNVQQLRAPQTSSLLSRPHPPGASTRRQFLRTGSVAALAVGSGLGFPRTARASSHRRAPADPHPIPYGTPFLLPDPTIFHVEAPGYPLPNPPFDTDPATRDPSTITDFKGFVGLVYVGGLGTHHDLVTDQTTKLYWEVDMRFMVGEYVGEDNRRHHATFGFV